MWLVTNTKTQYDTTISRKSSNTWKLKKEQFHDYIICNKKQKPLFLISRPLMLSSTVMSSNQLLIVLVTFSLEKFFRTLNPFHTTGHFLYPLKTLKDLLVFWCFQGYRKWSLVWNELRVIKLGTKYSRMNQIKFVEDSLYKNWRGLVCLKQTTPLRFFKGCLPQIFFGPFLNTLSHLWVSI